MRNLLQKRIETVQIIGQVVEIEDNSEIDQDLSRTTGRTIFRIMPGVIEDKTVEENIEMIVIDVMITLEAGIDQEIGWSQEFIAVIELEVQAVVGLAQDLEPVLIGIE